MKKTMRLLMFGVGMIGIIGVGVLVLEREAVARGTALPVDEEEVVAVEEAEAEAKAERVPETASEMVDYLLERSWREAGVEGNAPASDEVFLRRIYLHVAGRIPTKGEAEAFYASEGADKRAVLIDELLNSEGYVNQFYNFWADILRVNSGRGGGNNVSGRYAEYLKGALRDNLPYDEMVRELVTASGDPATNGATGYTIRDRGMPLDHMANTVRVFLGTRLECAQCHDHPFDKWTQMDFFQMAGFSYGMEARNNGGNKGTLAEVNRMISQDREMDRDHKRNLQRAMQEVRRPLQQSNSVYHVAEKLPQLPHDYQYEDGKPKEKIEPKVMFGEMEGEVIPDERVERYAAWMTSPENPRFTKVIVNRLWREVMGRGMIEPVDELTDETAASHPELMAFLEREMIQTGYDMKGFLRMLYNTKLYQREAAREEVAAGDDYEFTGPLMRRMSAEEVWDSVVTLINETPDRANWKQVQQGEIRAAVNREFMGGIDQTSPKAMMRSLEKIAEMQSAMSGKLARLEEQVREARAAKQNERVKTLSRQVNEMRNEIRQGVAKMIYGRALQKMSSKVIPVSFVPDKGEVKLRLSMIDNQGRTTREFQAIQSEWEQKLVEEEMDAAGILDEKERRAYAGYRRGVQQRYMRAANLPSPAPRGHFLRQFGQSDRITIENASDDASVPQALALMNGNTLRDLMQKYSVLSRNIAKAASPGQRVEALYLSVLGRYPTEAEQGLLLEEMEWRGEEFYGDVLFALLNSQEFMFVQ
ncbi:MAG: DUF1549 domain-containing protein [Verrucomicrobiota bacterium]